MSSAPIEFPPPVDSAKEFVGTPTDPEDERIEVGVAIVGGGLAGLACAIRLTQLLAEDEALMESLGEVPVALVEKGKARVALAVGGDDEPVGDAQAVPGPRRERLADVRPRPARSTCCRIRSGRSRSRRPLAVPQPRQPRHLVAQLGRWLSDQAEEGGVYILGETAATRFVEGGQRRALQGHGRGRDGEELSNFELGADLDREDRARRGHAGHLTGAAIRHFDLGLEDPQQWSSASRRWEVEKPLDRRDPHDGLAAPPWRQVPGVHGSFIWA